MRLESPFALTDQTYIMSSIGTYNKKMGLKKNIICKKKNKQHSSFSLMVPDST